MQMIRSLLDKIEHQYFLEGRPLARFGGIFRATDSFFYTPGIENKGTLHIRDAVDLKRVMITVVIALIPCAMMAIYNTGLQSNLAISAGALAPDTWREAVITFLNAGHSPSNLFDNVINGALWYFPILITTFAVGGIWEGLFATIRGHEVSEGFLVTGMLFPLIVPPMVPLWAIAVAISFGIVLGKEVFGGVGYNLFNPAITARALLFFGYPSYISGAEIWTAADSYSSPTALAAAAEGGLPAIKHSWMEAFIGFIPGSMGETSTLAILIGASILLLTGVGSWRIMLSALTGVGIFSTLLHFLGGTNPMTTLPFHWHLVTGGLAFAIVFMATDPVTAPVTKSAQLIYGFLIGTLIIVVRSLNPAYPDGLLVAILLMNVFSPLLDHFVVNSHIKRRKVRLGA